MQNPPQNVPWQDLLVSMSAFMNASTQLMNALNTKVSTGKQIEIEPWMDEQRRCLICIQDQTQRLVEGLQSNAAAAQPAKEITLQPSADKTAREYVPCANACEAGCKSSEEDTTYLSLGNCLNLSGVSKTESLKKDEQSKAPLSSTTTPNNTRESSLESTDFSKCNPSNCAGISTLFSSLEKNDGIKNPPTSPENFLPENQTKPKNNQNISSLPGKTCTSQTCSEKSGLTNTFDSSGGTDYTSSDIGGWLDLKQFDIPKKDPKTAPFAIYQDSPKVAPFAVYEDSPLKQTAAPYARNAVNIPQSSTRIPFSNIKSASFGKICTPETCSEKSGLTNTFNSSGGTDFTSSSMGGSLNKNAAPFAIYEDSPVKQSTPLNVRSTTPPKIFRSSSGTDCNCSSQNDIIQTPPNTRNPMLRANFSPGTDGSEYYNIPSNKSPNFGNIPTSTPFIEAGYGASQTSCTNDTCSIKFSQFDSFFTDSSNISNMTGSSPYNTQDSSGYVMDSYSYSRSNPLSVNISGIAPLDITNNESSSGKCKSKDCPYKNSSNQENDSSGSKCGCNSINESKEIPESRCACPLSLTKTASVISDLKTKLENSEKEILELSKEVKRLEMLAIPNKLGPNATTNTVQLYNQIMKDNALPPVGSAKKNCVCPSKRNRSASPASQRGRMEVSESQYRNPVVQFQPQVNSVQSRSTEAQQKECRPCNPHLRNTI